MKYLITFLLFLFVVNVNAQRMTFDLFDYQDIITPNDVELNTLIKNDDVIYREHAWGVMRDKGLYKIYDFDFDKMELNIYITELDMSVDTITANIFRILDTKDGLPSQFTTIYEGTEYMYCLTETIFGQPVFMMLYETDEHPWNPELAWSRGDYYAGFFTYHFELTLD